MKGGEGDELQRAIALYIDGEYQKAADTLLELSGELEDAEDLRTAYLYLGRSDMALGDYVGAADAFSRGMVLGGGIEFDEHLAAAQQHLRTAPGAIGTQTLTTRAQLAALIDHLFGQRLGVDSQAALDPPPDVGDHWARDYIVRVRAAGVMGTFADGGFHPDAPVTYPALYVTALRLTEAAGVPRQAVRDQFPEGFRGALEGPPGNAGRPAATAVVSGREAEEVLRSLREALPLETGK